MTSVKRTNRCLAVLLFGSAILFGCGGRDLELDPRQTLTTEDIRQNFAINIFASGGGATNYVVSVTFPAGKAEDTSPVTLPSGDVVSVNDVVLKLADDVATPTYVAKGSGNPETFTFVWTHGETVFKNVVIATIYPPVVDPAKVAKTDTKAIQVSGVLTGVTLSAAVNSGTAIAGPYFSLPLDVSGGGTAAATTVNLGKLTVGAGVVTLLETAKTGLKSVTAAGGQASVTVQFAYNVTISD